MSYTREQIESTIRRIASSSVEQSLQEMLRQLLAENDALRVEKSGMFDALEEIALAGMSGSGQESEEGMRDWHARRAWQFIGMAARAIDAARK